MNENLQRQIKWLQSWQEVFRKQREIETDKSKRTQLTRRITKLNNTIAEIEKTGRGLV